MNLIPSIVIDVSAMLVDTTHFRTPSGAISNTFETIKSNLIITKIQITQSIDQLINQSLNEPVKSLCHII